MPLNSVNIPLCVSLSDSFIQAATKYSFTSSTDWQLPNIHLKLRLQSKPRPHFTKSVYSCLLLPVPLNELCTGPLQIFASPKLSRLWLFTLLLKVNCEWLPPLLMPPHLPATSQAIQRQILEIPLLQHASDPSALYPQQHHSRSSHHHLRPRRVSALNCSLLLYFCCPKVHSPHKMQSFKT